MAHPLNDLLKKDKKFIWSNKCQELFDLLKKQFTEEPVLMMPDHTRPFQIQVNSSLFAIGGILTQMDTNGDCHPCAYLSKSLTKEQRNYDTGDRELLAIVCMLKEWQHYIQGSVLGFELSSVIVDSLKFKRGSEVESEEEKAVGLLGIYSVQRVN